MPKEILVWYAYKLRMRKGQTIKDIKEKIDDGELIFDSPDYTKITDSRGNTLMKKTRYTFN